MPNRVAIVGGGLAGLAAASALADRGLQVTLLESRPRLGGRASSFVDSGSGSVIDNCQHVAMGCCTNFSYFCQTVGIDRYFRREKELFFIGPDVRDPRRADRLVSSWLPAPLHLMGSFRRLSYLGRRDRAMLHKGLRALALTKTSDELEQHFEKWLGDHHQTKSAIDYFWKVVLVSALGEDLGRISVAYARKVFVDAFMANRHGWEVQIPTVPLDKLYGNQMTDWLSARDVLIRMQCGVRRLVIEDSTCTAVELRSGECVHADHIIVGVPHYILSSLLPESMQSHPGLRGFRELETAPIASVHLWFDRPITSLPHAVLVGRLSQWMFNRSLLQGQSSHRDQAASNESSSKPSRTYYLQVVISAARDLPGRSFARPGDSRTGHSGSSLANTRRKPNQPPGAAEQDLIDVVLSELSAIWPGAVAAHLVHSRLVTEHRAVFSPLPGADSLRPHQQSPISNVQLAGDWTQTGWPATMEGAVRSGYLAAENVLRHLGQRVKLIQPDLPPSALAKLLLRL